MRKCAKAKEDKSRSAGNKTFICLRSAMLIAQVLVGLSKQPKQIIQIEHNIVKNPNWPET